MTIPARKLFKRGFLLSTIAIATVSFGTQSAHAAITVVNDSELGTTLNTFEYAGTWATSAGASGKHLGDDHYSSATGSSYTLRFSGTQFELFAAKAPHHGKATVSIDGGAAITADLYASTRIENTSVYRSGSLTNGSHTVVVRVSGTRNTASSGTTIAIDRAAVTTLDLPVTVNDSELGTTAGTFQYAGTWATSTGVSGKYLGDDHYSSTTGSSYTFRFSGTQVELFAAKAPHHGKATVSIDGGAATTADLYASTRTENTSVYRSGSLTNGSHTVVVRVSGTRNTASSGTTIAIDRAAVTGSTTPPPPPPPPPPGVEVNEQFLGHDSITTSSTPWSLEHSGLPEAFTSGGMLKIPAYDDYHRVYYSKRRFGGPGKPLVIKMLKRLTSSRSSEVSGTTPGANIWFRVPKDGVDKDDWHNAISKTGVSSMIIRDGVSLGGRMEVIRYDGIAQDYILPYTPSKSVGYSVGTWKYVTHRYDWVSTDRYRVRLWHSTTGDPDMASTPIYDQTVATKYMNEPGFIAFRTDFVDAEIEYVTIDEL